jgi:hypothetical protein
MSVAVITYTPSAADAQRLAYTGVAKDDPADYTDPTIIKNRLDVKNFAKPVQDEILALWQQSIAGADGLKVVNKTGFTIVKGSLVCISGYSAPDSLPSIAKSDISSTTSINNNPASYVVTADILNNAIGVVFAFATVTGLDTSLAGAVGDPVFMSPTIGAWTLTLPNISYKQWYIGVVTVKDATVGAIFFYPGLHIDNSRQPFAIPVFNSTGSTIPAGPIALGPWIESNLSFNAILANGVRADAIVGVDLINGGFGVAQFLRSFTPTLDTTGAAIGNPVYQNNDGTIGLTPPTSQIIGYVKTLANPGVVKGWIRDPVPYRGSSTGHPASPLAGDTYYENGDGKVYIYANGGWIALT